MGAERERTGATERRRTAWRPTLVWLVLLLLVPAAYGLSGGLAGAFGAASSPPPPGNVILRVGMVNEPDSLNPFIGGSTTAYLVYHLNYDLLTGYRAADVAPAPELATSWTHTPDGKTWIFKLREGVTWQDGQPFTAADVAFTYNTIIKDKIDAFANYTGFINDVRAVDDHTVQFDCSRPKANMLGMWIPILPKHIWSSLSAAEMTRSFTNPTPIVGTGPFQVVEWKHSRYVRLKANPTYWRGKPKVDEVVISLYENPDVMSQDLQSGALDAAWGLPPAAFGKLSSVSGLKPIAYVVKGYDELGFNCYTGPSLGNPVLRDPAFRRALNWAIDKQKIVTFAYGGYAIAADTIIQSHFYTNPDWHWQPPASQAYGYDPRRAISELAAAGYKRSAGGKLLDKRGKPITLRLYACGAPPQGQSIGKLLVSWLRAIGISVNLQYMDEGAMNDKLYNTVGDVFTPDMDLYIYNWTGDVDPTFMLSIFLTDQINAWSDCAWSNSAYDQLFGQQLTSLDTKQRQGIIWQMQQIAYRESPYIPLVYPKGLEVVNTSRWDGWVQSPGSGSAIYSVDNIDSYLFVHPRAHEKSGGSPVGLVSIIVAAAVLVALGVVWLLLRKRPRAEEQAA